MYRSSSVNQAQGLQTPGVRLYIAGAVVDADGVHHRPGAVALAGGKVLAVGPVDAVRRAVGEAETLAMPNSMLVPALVNAHAHFGLNRIGYRPYAGTFTGWLGEVIGLSRASTFSPAASVSDAVADSRAAGVGLVGDICSGPEALTGLLDHPIGGVGYYEWLGFDPVDRLPELPDSAGPIVGIQPHAPYSTSPDRYRLASASGLPIATHLAETLEEIELVRDGAGAFVDFLRSRNLWHDEVASWFGTGQHPVDYLAELVDRPMLCAHCNYVEDAQLDVLRQRAWSVAYCPRASAYFQHTGHRYRDMLAAGINVALGTDSIICHGSLSVFDEMRFLYQRDQADPITLLRMATANGHAALGGDAKQGTFAIGATPGLTAIDIDPEAADPLAEALGRKTASGVRLILDPGAWD